MKAKKSKVQRKRGRAKPEVEVGAAHPKIPQAYTFSGVTFALNLEPVKPSKRGQKPTRK